MLEAFGLSWLASIVSSVVSAAVNERTKPKASPETAKNRALALYQALRNVETLSGEFAAALEAVADFKWGARASGGAGATLTSLVTELHRITNDLRASLEEVRRTVAAIDPQLAIHQPEVSRALEEFVGTRGFLIERLEDMTPHLQPDELGPAEQKEVRRLAIAAKQNHQLIQRTMESFRAFLAGEFAFKESF
jgi:hypothetical protein